MIANDETLVKRRCYECGDALEHPVTGAFPRCPGGCRNPFLSCPACGDIFRPEQPPDVQEVYLIHGCKAGKVRARMLNPTCLHCGAAKAGTGAPCGCPADIAKRKADADSLKAKQDADRQQRELQDKEREVRFRTFTPMMDLPGLRKVAQRDRQDAELADRERTVKERELSRRERRQDGYDDADDSGQVEGGEPLSAFEMPMDGSDLDNAPTAMLQRKDGATLFYDGKLNFCFGVPGGGKSWVALHCVHETLLQGHRAIYWDHEDTPGTLSRRSKKMGLDLADYWRDGQFKYLRPGLDGSTLAMTEALEWARGGDGPTLVVIDSAESAGCPSDGADVAPWLAKIVQPFLDAGCTVLVLDHVPKRKEGRPMGPIGSQHKLARIDGAALFVTGVPWTQKTDGYLVLTNHKDRHGQLPAPIGKAVARLIGTHEGDSLHLSIVAPETEDNIEEAYIPTLRALAGAGPDGAYGQQAMRNLVVGRGSQRDKAIGDLVSLGFIMKTPGKRLRYTLTDLGREELATDDEE